MLGNLRKKLSNALQEASDSIQHQYRQRVSSPATPTTPTSDDSRSFGAHSLVELGIAPDVNMAAGCNLLSKYEDDWKAIHDLNDVNAQKAEQVAAQIEDIAKRTTNQHLVMTDLISCLSGVPLLLTKLQKSMQTLEELNALTATVEEEFCQLQNLCEECDLQEFMLHKQFELQQYKQAKMVKLELYRQKVAAEHDEKIRRHEDRLRQMQRERQAVFDNAFRGDLEEFKQKGMLTKIENANASELSLEEVVLEDAETKDALEDFLNG